MRLPGPIWRLLSPPPKDAGVKFSDLSEYPPEDLVPFLDRPGIDESTLTPAQAAWRRDGVLHLPGFIPDSLTDPYIRRREQLTRRHGWRAATPYTHIPEMRDLALYPPLMEAMEALIGEQMMLHLCLTGWISTERTWHQDDYLNPPFVNSWYAAVWIALGDIHPESGPFEYVPGSHRWPLMRGENVKRYLTAEEKARRKWKTGINLWPEYAERFVTPAIDAEIIATRSRIVRHIARKGDVLIWHGRLIHCGSRPVSKRLERRCLIAHYSGVHHRPDMPAREIDQNGQVYAVFGEPLIV